MSPGLERARQPFRLRNAITGLVLASFAIGVWAYSIGAVKQDVFDDADEEARELARSGAHIKSLEDQERERRAAETEAHATAGAGGITPLQTAPPTPSMSPVVEARTAPSVPTDRPRGVVAGLLYERYPKMFDPKTKTLVWGAPPVDNVGKLKSTTIASRK